MPASLSLSAKVHEIQTLILSYHPVIAIETVEEERIQQLLQRATQEMQLPLFEWSLAQGLIRSPGANNTPWTNEYAPPGTQRPTTIAEDSEDALKMLKHVQDMSVKAVFWLKDFGKPLEDAAVARQFRELVQQFSHHRSALILTGDSVRLPPEVAHDAVFFDLKLPGREELEQVLQETVRSLKTKHRVQIELQETDTQALVQALRGMTLKQARQVIAYAALEDGKLTSDDVQRIIQRKAQVIHQGGILEYFPVESKPLNLAGFAGLKRWLAQAKVGFSPAAQAINLQPPKGILIVGVQGCGKSLAAKAIARDWQMPLLKLDAGRLYDKYVGESERNFRQAVLLAESMSPAVLWIDEIEKSLGASMSGDSDGGLSRRLFGFFLTWMQEKSQEVFVIATANDLSQVPPELLRKGRFDEIFFVDLPDEKERGVVLQTHLLQRQQTPRQFDFPALIQATDGFSGAEIEQAVIAALYQALYQNQPLDTALLLHAIKTTIPLSVSRREDVQKLRSIARERFVSVR